MKARIQILIALLAGFTIASESFAQEKKKNTTSTIEMVKQEIASQSYKINISTALPMQGRNIPLTSPYFLEIKNDTVISHLPYFGRAYRIPYDGGDGLDFKAQLKDYTVDTDKKGNIQIKFSTRTIEDLFEYRIKIYDNGSSNIDVSMQNRQGISFIGDMELDKQKK